MRLGHEIRRVLKRLKLKLIFSVFSVSFSRDYQTIINVYKTVYWRKSTQFIVEFNLSPTTNSIFVMFFPSTTPDRINREKWIELYASKILPHIKAALTTFSTFLAGGLGVLQFSADDLMRQLKQMCLTRADTINQLTKLHFCTKQLSLLYHLHSPPRSRSILVCLSRRARCIRSLSWNCNEFRHFSCHFFCARHLLLTFCLPFDLPLNCPW